MTFEIDFCADVTEQLLQLAKHIFAEIVKTTPTDASLTYPLIKSSVGGGYQPTPSSSSYVNHVCC